MIKIITKFGKLIWKRENILSNIDNSTGKSFSETLILASVNPWEIVHWIPPKNTSLEHVVFKNCFLFLFWHSKQYLYTTCSELVFLGGFNEQSLVILWVNWFKNESFWHRFTCNGYGVSMPVRLGLWI